MLLNAEKFALSTTIFFATPSTSSSQKRQTVVGATWSVSLKWTEEKEEEQEDASAPRPIRRQGKLQFSKGVSEPDDGKGMEVEFDALHERNTFKLVSKEDCRFATPDFSKMGVFIQIRRMRLLGQGQSKELLPEATCSPLGL